MIIVKFEKIEDKLMKFPMLHCEFYLYGLRERVLILTAALTLCGRFVPKEELIGGLLNLKLIYREVGRKNDRNEF